MTEQTIDGLDVPCDCCGITGRQGGRMTFTGRSGQPMKVLCDTCERLIKDGLLRPETQDGQLVYRQWHYQPMTPGELLPRFRT